MSLEILRSIFSNSNESIYAFFYLKEKEGSLEQGPNLREFKILEDIPAEIFKKKNWIDGYLFNESAQVQWCVRQKESYFIVDGNQKLDEAGAEISSFPESDVNVKTIEHIYMVKENLFKNKQIKITEYLKFDQELLSWNVQKVLLKKIKGREVCRNEKA